LLPQERKQLLRPAKSENIVKCRHKSPTKSLTIRSRIPSIQGDSNGSPGLLEYSHYPQIPRHHLRLYKNVYVKIPFILWRNILNFKKVKYTHMNWIYI
jgi:hypothetical protein